MLHRRAAWAPTRHAAAFPARPASSKRPRDPYDVLSVPRDATKPQIKKAYYDIAKTSHPDMNPGDAAARERFSEAMRAYQLLSDDARRLAFDQGASDPGEALGTGDGEGGAAGGAGADAGVDALALFEQMMRESTGAAHGGPALTDELLRRAGRREPPGAPDPGAAREAPPVRLVVEATLAEAARGTQVLVQGARVRVRCGECAGCGGSRGAPQGKCSACAGTGRTPRRAAGLQLPLFLSAQCARCRGTGQCAAPCAACSGEGHREVEADVVVRVPAGACDGQVVRVGAPEGVEFAGPVTAAVAVKEDAVYRREGEDLHVVVPVTLDEAFQGVEKRVPALLGGVETVVLPRGMPWESTVVNYGKGVSDKGNLVVHFTFSTPGAPEKPVEAEGAQEVTAS